MDKYIGARMIEAEPMLFAGAVNHGYYKSKAHFDILTKGYHVRYSDGSDKWMPKDLFEKEFLLIKDDAEISEEDSLRFCKQAHIPYVASVRECLTFVLRWAKNGLRK